MAHKGGASSPSLSTSFFIYLQAFSISSSPVKNSKISPSSSKQWIFFLKKINFIFVRTKNKILKQQF